MHCTLSSALSPTAVDQQATLFDLASLLAQLRRLSDRRCPKGLRYPLGPVLLLIILAKLAGEDKPQAIADWLSARGRSLRQAAGPTLAADAPSQYLSAHSGRGGEPRGTGPQPLVSI